MSTYIDLFSGIGGFALALRTISQPRLMDEYGIYLIVRSTWKEPLHYGAKLIVNYGEYENIDDKLGIMVEVQWCCSTAHLYEEQISIAVTAMTQRLL